MLQSLKLPEQAYFSNYVRYNKHQRKMLELFIQSSSHRSITLTARGLFTIPMNLSVFLSVIYSNMCREF